MKKNVQSKGHFKMYKAGKKWVSYGLSVMGVALVVGTPVMSATLQLTTPETASAASVQATDLTQVPGSVLTAARTQSNVDLSNNGEFSAWLVAAVKNWDNWSDQTAARNALAELGKAFAKNKKLKSVDLSGTFAAANAADTHGGHDAALLFWAMQLSDVKTASFETLDLSNNNFTPELTNTVYIADGINKTVKHLLFGNSSAELLATIHANGNNNYASDGHHGFGGKFIQADVSDTEMVPNEPQYMTSEGNVPNAPVMASSANVPNDPIYVASSNVPNDPIYVASSNVPNDPIMTSEANVPNDPVMASSANVPNDPIYVASSNVPNAPIESPVNRVTADDTDRAKNAMTDEAAKQNVAENATVVASIDDIAHAETPAALQQAVDRAAVAISNAVSLPETAAKGAQDKNALLVALTIMASLVTFAFVQKRK